MQSAATTTDQTTQDSRHRQGKAPHLSTTTTLQHTTLHLFARFFVHFLDGGYRRISAFFFTADFTAAGFFFFFFFTADGEKSAGGRKKIFLTGRQAAGKKIFYA